MMAVMHDRGLLDFDQKVSKYWPEFAKNGKEFLTVADIMRHDGGLHKFNECINLEDAWTENIK